MVITESKRECTAVTVPTGPHCTDVTSILYVAVNVPYLPSSVSSTPGYNGKEKKVNRDRSETICDACFMSSSKQFIEREASSWIHYIHNKIFKLVVGDSNNKKPQPPLPSGVYRYQSQQSAVKLLANLNSAYT